MAMQQLEHPTTTAIQADSSNNDVGGSSSSSIFSASPSPIQENWVGKVQELVMKRRLKSRWNDVYTQIGTANTLEHSCLLNFDILDASGQTTIHHLEGNGQARGKKMAKQLASKQVFDQLQQLYGTVLTMPSTAAVEKPTAALGDQNMQTHEPMDTSSTPIAVDPVGPNAGNNHNKLTMEEGERVETDELDAEKDEKPNLQVLLYKILNGNRPGTEKMFRYILDLKDAQVERLFPRVELKFVESTRTEDYVQVYLEVWVNADGKQRSLPCTHGGAGATMEAARDDACLQAMSYLYIFGGFSPSESAEEKK